MIPLKQNEMKNILLNTAYFPPISYFSAIKQAESVFIERYENFGKQSYRNRCEIMTANGIIPLVVPVSKGNSKTLIKDLKIVYATPWQKLHFRSIESAYKNSPYYEYYIDDIMPFFEQETTYLYDLNMSILVLMTELLKIHRPIKQTEDYIPEGTSLFTDLRNTIHPKPSRCRSGIKFSPHLYRQTFSDRFPFMPNLSILDLLFCCGPESYQFL